MRITDRQQTDLLLAAVKGFRRDIFVRNEQISSGKRVNRPSDDPQAFERITQFRNLLQTTSRRISSVEEGQTRLTLSENVLNSAGNLLIRAKELAVALRNDTNSANDRTNAAKEVNQLFQGFVEVANTRLAGHSLFAGFKTQADAFALPTTSGGSIPASPGPNNTGGATVSASVATPASLKPDLYEVKFTSSTQFDVVDLTTNQTLSTGNGFTSGTAFTFDGLSVTISNGTGPPNTGDVFHVRPGFSYKGDSNSIAVEVGDQKRVNTTIPGDQVFSGPTVNILTTLQDLHQALATNDGAGIEASIGKLDTALTQMNNARADLGSRVNRLDTIKESLNLLTVNTEGLRSSFEDTDIAKVAGELASLQTDLQASMAVLTKQFDTSLLKFLR